MTGESEDDQPGDELLTQIRRRAWQRNRRRARDLSGIVETLTESGSLSSVQLQHARSVTHQLIGSAGTFGHQAVTRTAMRIRQLLPTESTPTTGADLVELTTLVAEMAALLEDEPVADQ